MKNDPDAQREIASCASEQLAVLVVVVGMGVLTSSALISNDAIKAGITTVGLSMLFVSGRLFRTEHGTCFDRPMVATFVALACCGYVPLTPQSEEWMRVMSALLLVVSCAWLAGKILRDRARLSLDVLLVVFGSLLAGGLMVISS